MRDRARFAAQGLRGAELVAWLAAHPAAARDAALEELLGIRDPPVDRSPPDAEAIGYVPSGVAPLVRAVLDAPITRDDVLVDLGAGMGKVAFAVHLLTGARTLGVERRPDLVARAREVAERHALEDVTFVEGDARDADLGEATVFFLYLPFTGDVLATVMGRIRSVATRRDVVICALGLDLRGWDFVVERDSQEFWLSIYDSRVPGAVPRAQRVAAPLGQAAERVARQG